MMENKENNQNESKEVTIQSLDQRLSNIEEMTQKLVLIDKYYQLQTAWEKSAMRTILIAITTYILSAIFLYILNFQYFYINAVLPTVGFMLTTLSIPFIKRIWIKYYLKEKDSIKEVLS